MNERKLGRDQLFYVFFDRNSYIRTSSDIVGPCGDEKNGCRENWLSHLILWLNDAVSGRLSDCDAGKKEIRILGRSWPPPDVQTASKAAKIAQFQFVVSLICEKHNIDFDLVERTKIELFKPNGSKILWKSVWVIYDPQSRHLEGFHAWEDQTDTFSGTTIQLLVQSYEWQTFAFLCNGHSKVAGLQGNSKYAISYFMKSSVTCEWILNVTFSIIII